MQHTCVFVRGGGRLQLGAIIVSMLSQTKSEQRHELLYLTIGGCMKKTAFVILSLFVVSFACIASGPTVPFTQAVELGLPSGPYYVQSNHATMITSPNTGTVTLEAHLHGVLILGDEEYLYGYVGDDWDCYLEDTAYQLPGNPVVDVKHTFTVDLGDAAPEIWIQKPYYVPVPPGNVTAFSADSFYRVTILTGVNPD